MARRKNKRDEDVLTGSLVAMIDVVFQLIIFFVCTVSMQERAVDESIVLPDAPHGKPLESKPPNEFRVDVDRRGVVTWNRMPITEKELTAILAKNLAETHDPELPVVIRGASEAKHKDIRKVMDACTKAGIAKIRILAVQESVKK